MNCHPHRQYIYRGPAPNKIDLCSAIARCRGTIPSSNNESSVLLFYALNTWFRLFASGKSGKMPINAKRPRTGKPEKSYGSYSKKYPGDRGYIKWIIRISCSCFSPDFLSWRQFSRSSSEESAAATVTGVVHGTPSLRSADMNRQARRIDSPAITLRMSSPSRAAVKV